MKKYIFLAAAALVALAACSKVEPVTVSDPEAITFNVVNYANSTKADPADHLEFTGDNFGAYAWVTNTKWAETEVKTFFWGSDPQIITKQGGVWTTSTPYFWPKQAMLTFASYAPFAPNGGVKPVYSTENKQWTMSDYTIPDETKEDLMFADLVTDLTGNVTTPENQAGNNGGKHFADGVPTLFHHKLTKVNFQFVLAEDETTEISANVKKYPNIADVYIVVNRASIVNIKNTGSYANNGWTPKDDATAEYTFVTSDKTLETQGAPVAADVKYRILLPQTLVASAANAPGQQLKINYTIKTKYVGSNDYLNETIEELYDLVGTTVPAWNQNMDILYTVKIYPTAQNPIYFDPAVTAWDSQVTQDIDVNKLVENVTPSGN